MSSPSQPELVQPQMETASPDTPRSGLAAAETEAGSSVFTEDQLRAFEQRTFQEEYSQMGPLDRILMLKEARIALAAESLIAAQRLQTLAQQELDERNRRNPLEQEHTAAQAAEQEIIAAPAA
jgi:hypothetical protein